MKVQLILPLSVVVCVALLGIMKIRSKEHQRELKRNSFDNIKLRVTNDVLGEYQKELVEMERELEKSREEHKLLEGEVKTLGVKADSTKGETDACYGSMKTTKDETATAETQLSNLKGDIEKEQASWKTEEETLKSQLAARSAVCDYVKKDSQAASNLCGSEAPKQEEKKEEAPKQEEKKEEAPKQEEKKEEKKEEAPKEEKKEEAPKEEKKEEAPKEEEKKEEKKEEAPKEEEKKEEAPKEEEKKEEAPKEEKKEEKKEEAPKEEEKKEEKKEEAPKEEEKKEEKKE